MPNYSVALRSIFSISGPFILLGVHIVYAVTCPLPPSAVDTPLITPNIDQTQYNEVTCTIIMAFYYAPKSHNNIYHKFFYLLVQEPKAQLYIYYS